jgi:succinate dehydrogenase / fumarate reductase cytochrome b subunit
MASPAAVLALPGSTVGKKVIMAVTGLIMVLFVIVHMAGNLHIFEGPAKMNVYGGYLREIGEPILPHEAALWLLRLILLASVGLHIWAAVTLTRQDLASRPVGYRVKQNISGGYAAGIMRYGGVLLAVFIVFHILHMTTGTVHPAFQEGKPYENLISGLRLWPVALFYVVAMVALGTHLNHGTWSMAQTLGWVNRTNSPFWRWVALVVTVVVTLGFITVPLAVALGIVR